MPYKKTNYKNDRNDTFYAIGKIYEIVITKKEFYREYIIEDLELNNYGFEVAIKSIRKLILANYPWAMLVYVKAQDKYVFVC
jgi:hypothetical protein